MQELFLKTENGNFPIDPEIINKYHLKKGTHSPFTNGLVVDRFGDASIEKKFECEALVNDDKSEDGLTLTTAEALDFAMGSDS